MRHVLPFLAAMLLVSGTVLGGGQAKKKTNPEQAYYRAFYQEKGLRDFATAEKEYRVAIEAAKAGSKKDLLVSSLLGRARCLAALGRAKEAKAVFGQVLAIDPKNAEAKRGIGKAPAKAGDDLAARIFALVQKLGGPERSQAQRDLQLVGDRAIPALADGLRSDEVGIVEGSAQTLARMGKKTANATLAAAFSDPAVKFPNALISVLRKPPGADVTAFTAAFKVADAQTRPSIVRAFGFVTVRWRTESPGDLVQFFKTVFSSGDPSAVSAALPILGNTRLQESVRKQFGAKFWAQMLAARSPEVVNAAGRTLDFSTFRSIWDADLGNALLRAALRFLRGDLPSDSWSWALHLGGMRPSTVDLSQDLLLDLYAAAAGLGGSWPSKFRGGLWGFLMAKPGGRAARLALFKEGWARITDAAGRCEWCYRWIDRGVDLRVVAGTAVADSEPSVRSLGYHAFLDIDPKDVSDAEKAFPHLLDDIGASDSKLVQNALQVAGRFKVKSAVPAIRKRLDSPGPDSLRGTEASALERTAGKAATPDLRKLLSTDDWPAARSPLIDLLGTGVAPDLVALAKRLENGAYPVLQRDAPGAYSYTHVAVPKAVFQAYFDQLPKDLRSRWFLNYAFFLSWLRSDQIRALVDQALASDSVSWQQSGVEAAGKYHLTETWPTLLALLESPDVSVQNAAQKALSEIRTYLDLKASFSRYEAGGPAKALATARKLLTSKDPAKRRGGAYAIAALGDPAGVPDLMKLLDDPDPQVRQAALDALAHLAGVTGRKPPSPAAPPGKK